MHFMVKAFALDSVDDKTQINVMLTKRLLNYCNVLSQINNLIKIIHYDETKKRAYSDLFTLSPLSLPHTFISHYKLF